MSKRKRESEWLYIGEKDKGVPRLLHRADTGHADLAATQTSVKIAAFDIDHTIIRPKSGGKFPKDAGDWTWCFDSVTAAITEWHDKGYTIVFFSNQAGITKMKPDTQQARVARMIERMTQFDSVVDALRMPVSVLVCPANNEYRKPSRRLWEYFLTHHNIKNKIDYSNSFYSGDAAGRVKTDSRKPDFSCADRMFAANAGLMFLTPETFFLKRRKREEYIWSKDGFNIKDFEKDYRSGGEAATSKTPFSTFTASAHPQEVVVLVGCPASGKTTVAREFAKKGYERVNMDTLGTHQACLKAATAALGAKKSVVIDNTNPDKESRARYTALAKKFNVTARALVMSTPRPLAVHMNLFRAVFTNGERVPVPQIGFNMFFSKYRKSGGRPCLSEGFERVDDVPFQISFQSSDHERLFFDWTSS